MMVDRDSESWQYVFIKTANIIEKLYTVYLTWGVATAVKQQKLN